MSQWSATTTLPCLSYQVSNSCGSDWMALHPNSMSMCHSKLYQKYSDLAENDGYGKVLLDHKVIGSWPGRANGVLPLPHPCPAFTKSPIDVYHDWWLLPCQYSIQISVKKTWILWQMLKLIAMARHLCLIKRHGFLAWTWMSCCSATTSLPCLYQVSNRRGT